MPEAVHISAVMREIMEKFIPNKRFKKQYDELYKKEPLAANAFLLLAELADEKGQVKIQGSNEKEVAQELSRLMKARFNNTVGYAL